MSKRIYLLNDILKDQMEILSQDELVGYSGIRTNSLEYGSIWLKIHTFLKKLGISNTQTIREIGPINTFIDGIINMDFKRVSKLYKSLNSGKDSILINIMIKEKKRRFLRQGGGGEWC